MQVQKYRFGVRLRRLPDLYPLVATCEVVVPTWERPEGRRQVAGTVVPSPSLSFLPPGGGSGHIRSGRSLAGRPGLCRGTDLRRPVSPSCKSGAPRNRRSAASLEDGERSGEPEDFPAARDWACDFNRSFQSGEKSYFGKPTDRAHLPARENRQVALALSGAVSHVTRWRCKCSLLTSGINLGPPARKPTVRPCICAAVTAGAGGRRRRRGRKKGTSY